MFWEESAHVHFSDLEEGVPFFSFFLLVNIHHVGVTTPLN